MASAHLILIRHAHRDTSSGRARDNGLSPKGRLQARALAKYFSQRATEWQQISFFSSPALRCQETLRPLAKKSKTQPSRLIHLSPFLQESTNLAETAANLKKLIQETKKSPSGAVIIVCGHGDTLPIWIEKLTGIEITVKKGSWTEIIRRGKRWELHKVLSDFA